jgi:hypothetical protein
MNEPASRRYTKFETSDLRDKNFVFVVILCGRCVQNFEAANDTTNDNGLRNKAIIMNEPASSCTNLQNPFNTLFIPSFNRTVLKFKISPWRN